MTLKFFRSASYVIHNLCVVRVAILKTVIFCCVENIFTIMAFVVDQEFDSFEDLLKTKKEYEVANNIVLVRRDTHLLKGEGDIVKKIMYSRLSLQCKAGKERPSESKGMRKSSTLKKNCPMRVSLLN